MGRLWFRLRHALLAAVLAALVLRTFQIVLFGHSDQTFRRFSDRINAIQSRRVPPHATWNFVAPKSDILPTRLDLLF
jgi:hypothetical protein